SGEHDSSLVSRRLDSRGFHREAGRVRGHEGAAFLAYALEVIHRAKAPLRDGDNEPGAAEQKEECSVFVSEGNSRPLNCGLHRLRGACKMILGENERDRFLQCGVVEPCVVETVPRAGVPPEPDKGCENWDSDKESQKGIAHPMGNAEVSNH